MDGQGGGKSRAGYQGPPPPRNYAFKRASSSSSSSNNPPGSASRPEGGHLQRPFLGGEDVRISVALGLL